MAKYFGGAVALAIFFVAIWQVDGILFAGKVNEKSFLVDFSAVAMNWTEADQHCTSLNLTLATIENEDEAYILASNLPKDLEYWINGKEERAYTSSFSWAGRIPASAPEANARPRRFGFNQPQVQQQSQNEANQFDFFQSYGGTNKSSITLCVNVDVVDQQLNVHSDLCETQLYGIICQEIVDQE